LLLANSFPLLNVLTLGPFTPSVSRGVVVVATKEESLEFDTDEIPSSGLECPLRYWRVVGRIGDRPDSELANESSWSTWYWML